MPHPQQRRYEHRGLQPQSFAGLKRGTLQSGVYAQTVWSQDNMAILGALSSIIGGADTMPAPIKYQETKYYRCYAPTSPQAMENLEYLVTQGQIPYLLVEGGTFLNDHYYLSARETEALLNAPDAVEHLMEGRPHDIAKTSCCDRVMSTCGIV